MSSENYVNLYFDEEKIRLTVLTNICRMLVTRGYMDIMKYKPQPDKNIKKSIVEQPSSNDHIENGLFLPYIETRTDSGIYTIPLDKPYKDQRDSKGVAEDSDVFDGSVVIVKIIPQDVKDVSNSPILNEFLKTYSKNHKIIVFDKMADKVYTALSKKKNVEVFERVNLMIDLMSHVCAPIRCDFVTLDDINYITNPKMSKILENDPLSRYYNAKKGNTMRIVRPSLNNSVEVIFRKVIEPKLVFKT